MERSLVKFKIPHIPHTSISELSTTGYELWAVSFGLWADNNYNGLLWAVSFELWVYNN
jgi:hypothetical protein